MHGTLTLFGELISRFNPESQYGPIPGNVGGPGAFFVPLL
jgi:hypothetical protein